MAAEKQGKNRGKGHPPVETQFKPGQSGNPGGRPKDSIKSLARERSEDAFNRITHLMEKSRSERIQLMAAEIILAYAWGKPAQEIAVNTDPLHDIAGQLKRARDLRLEMAELRVTTKDFTTLPAQYARLEAGETVAEIVASQEGDGPAYAK